MQSATADDPAAACVADPAHQQQHPAASSSSSSSLSSSASLHSGGDYDEQILKLMHTLGIEPCKTVEVQRGSR